MNPPLKRHDVFVDIFDQIEQHAQVLPGSSPAEFIEAILDEFKSEIEYMGFPPAAYQLVRKSSGNPLDNDRPIGQQIGDGEGLIFQERSQPPPEGASALEQQVYLREETSQSLYRIHWHPARLGRKADPLLVPIEQMLTASTNALSRHQADLVEVDGQLYIDHASASISTIIETAAGQRTTLAIRGQQGAAASRRHALSHRDTITFGNAPAGIQLTVLIRERKAGAA
jgi:hypothetical protein